MINIFLFFNYTTTTEIYTLSLHDALPICEVGKPFWEAKTEVSAMVNKIDVTINDSLPLFKSYEIQEIMPKTLRSEEHTSELQSQSNLVCRLLLEKKNKKKIKYNK